MKANSFLRKRFFPSPVSAFISILAALTMGCSSANVGPPKPRFSGNTNVTLMLSSTANDQLVQFAIGLTGITLTSRSGKTATLLSQPQGTQQWAEFIHVNGGAEPLLTVSVPQGLYTAARVSVDQSYFSCVTLTPSGGLDTSMFAYGATPNNAPATNVTVNLPSPLTITGSSMGLLLDLHVTQSATYSSCYSTGINPFSITPTFNLTPIQFAPQPTNPNNGRVAELEGEVGGIDSAANNLTLTLPESPRTVSISSSSTTVYQGLNDFSALSAGAFLAMDGAIQPDGSLLATRIAVQDPGTSNVSVLQGPVLQLGISDPVGNKPASWVFGIQQQGFFSANHEAALAMPYELSTSEFHISGALSNLQLLPFVPGFNGSNMVAGQNVYVTTHATQFAGPAYIPAATVTLMPQTINGTIVGASQVGSFTDYSVSLASYDLFPTLAVQPGQTTQLSNPSQIEVYVDKNTQMLNTQPLAASNTLRFYGLIFNDNGTLRMDCAQISDGATSSSTTNAASWMQTGVTKILDRSGSGGIQHIVTAVTRSAAK
jgi:hypothetical protein